jgi:acetolactate decarboxylase
VQQLSPHAKFFAHTAVPIIDPHLLHGIHLTRLRHAGVVADEAEDDTVFQTSSISALLDGAYEGDVTFGELAQHGDFGIGTLQQLDGEMIALDGTFYAARADGRISVIPPDTRTPFAVVVPWRTDGDRLLDAAPTLDALAAQIDRAVPPDGTILAIRVDGHFSHVRARSVPKQHPPYPTLAEVAARQVVFNWHELDATLVGFRCPASVGGYDLVGYHWHVLSDDRTRGGHLLECRLTAGLARFHRADELHVEIPTGLAWHPPDGNAGRDAVLKRIESDVS